MSLAPMPVMEDVSSVIGSLYQNDQIVKLTRQYKGITLAQEARVVEVTPESATLQASQTRQFPWMDGEIHLHNRTLPRTVAARMRNINPEQGMFLLSNLAFADWKTRKSERVQPQKPTYVSIAFHRLAYRALLEDISLEGIGILANKNVDPQGRLRVGAKLSVSFKLPPHYEFNGIKGTLLYRQKAGLQLIKFGVHLSPNENEKAALAEFVNQRREEILQELDQANTYIRQPQRIENLYF